MLYILFQYKSRKFTAQQKRKILVEAYWKAHTLTLSTINIVESFKKLGQIWTPDSTINLRALPSFQYDPPSSELQSDIHSQWIVCEKEREAHNERRRTIELSASIVPVPKRQRTLTEYFNPKQ